MKRIAALLFLIFSVEISASTIIVNSIFDNEEFPRSSEAAAAVEDGLMDIFFDSGFIMFSTFNAGDYRVEGAKDARYMITIEPLKENFAVSFMLQATVNGMILDSGTVDLSAINADPSSGDNKLYYLIGEVVAQKLIQFF